VRLSPQRVQQKVGPFSPTEACDSCQLPRIQAQTRLVMSRREDLSGAAAKFLTSRPELFPSELTKMRWKERHTAA